MVIDVEDIEWALERACWEYHCEVTYKDSYGMLKALSLDRNTWDELRRNGYGMASPSRT